MEITDNEPKIDLASFLGDPNIGLYIFATDSYALIPLNTHDSLLHKIEKVLSVPVIKTNIAGTSLLGALLAGDSDLLLVPDIAFDTELEILRKNKVPFEVIHTELTALGNNIVSSEKSLLVNPDYDIKARSKFREITGKKIVSTDFGELKTFGSLIKVKGDRALISPLLENKKEQIKDLLNLKKVFVSNVNFGNPFVSSGLVVNNKGMLIGEKTTGFESMQIEQAFGFTKYE